MNAIGKKEIDDLIASLIGSKNTTNNDNDIPLNDTTNIVKHDESDINKHVHHLNAGPQVELQSVDQEIFQLPPKVYSLPSFIKKTITYELLGHCSI